MLYRKYQRLGQEHPLVRHGGIFKREISFLEAVALIVSGTIGAGILGIPYAVSKVGIGIGVVYIVLLGLLVMGLNLFLGEVTARSNSNLHLVGIAREYLGKTGQVLMALILYLMWFGVLVVFTIGEGRVLSELFGGTAFMWSVIFFVVGNLLVIAGLKVIKTVDFFLSLGLLLVIAIMAAFAFPHMDVVHMGYSNFAYLLFPYGVILFAYSGSASVVEAHAVLKGRDSSFKKAIVISGVITILAYVLFTLVVVGVTGPGTTEVATVGLGRAIGKSMLVFGNVFAVLAMGTTFLIIGMSLKDSLTWDYKMPKYVALPIVIFVPFFIFLLGVRQFVAAIDVVGGVFISAEMLMIVLIYWRAKHIGHLKRSKYNLHYTLLSVVLLTLAFAIGAVYSVAKLF